MKAFLTLALFLTFAAVCPADETIRAAQEALKSEGFYYGEADGSPGAETDAAIRRYQIRNGLEVTGKMNAETLKALGVGGGAPPAPVPQEAAPPPPVTSSSPSEIRIAPVPPSSAAPKAPPVPSAPGFSLRAYFSRTPYEAAPSGMQQEIVRRAQFILHQTGYYEGGLDGAPGPATVRAMERFQQDRRMPVSGRLDMPTLERMRLLPVLIPNRRYYSPWGF